jgi:hypothetical protein
MGHPPPCRRPNATSSRRRNADILPFIPISVSTPVLVAKHLHCWYAPRAAPLPSRRA